MIVTLTFIAVIPTLKGVKVVIIMFAVLEKVLMQRVPERVMA